MPQICKVIRTTAKGGADGKTSRDALEASVLAVKSRVIVVQQPPAEVSVIYLGGDKMRSNVVTKMTVFKMTD